MRLSEFVAYLKYRCSHYGEGLRGLRNGTLFRCKRTYIPKDEEYFDRHRHGRKCNVVMGTENFIHPWAIVDQGGVIGGGSRVWAGTHIMAGAKVGQNCNIGEHCFIESGVKIGDGVTIKNNVALYDGAEIEDDVFLGPSCVFTNVVNPRAFVSRKSEFKKTLVKQGASIGANATIICGHDIGRYALIGAGAVVTQNIPDYAIAYGCPAEIRGWVCQCGVALRFQDGQSVCPACSRAFFLQNGIAVSEKINRIPD